MARTLAIGDIHGCYAALLTLSEAAAFGPDDTLIFLGDYIDRGLESKEVVDWLIARGAEGGCVFLRGNHEIMLLQAREDARQRMGWLQVGGAETMTSYERAMGHGGWGAIPDTHWDFFERDLVALHETGTHIFAHAGLAHDRPLDKQPDNRLYWERFGGLRPHLSGKTVVCGHTVQRGGDPVSVGHGVCLDTGVYLEGGWLTCLDVASGTYWQANERGEARDGTLS